jgi:hypothetical protein
MVLDNNNNIYVTGQLSPGMFFRKYDSSFNIVWSMSFNGPGAEVGYSLAYDSVNNLIYISGAAYNVNMNPLGDPINLTYNDDNGWFVASYNPNGIMQNAHLFANSNNGNAFNSKLRVINDKLLIYGLYRNSPDLDISNSTFTPSQSNNSNRGFVSVYNLNNGPTLTGQYFFGTNSTHEDHAKQLFLSGNNLIVSTSPNPAIPDPTVRLYDYNQNPLVTLSSISYENNPIPSGWSGLVSFNIGDLIPPVITLLGNSPVTIQVGSTYTDAGATALDNYDGNLTSSIVVTGSVNTAVVGTYTLSYNVSDSSGNAAVTVTRTVNVVDTLSNENFILDNFKLFPNPSEEYINISSPFTVLTIDIYDINGKSVLKVIDNNKELIINISKLSTGMYTMIINNKFKFKLIKK